VRPRVDAKVTASQRFLDIPGAEPE
jgi:hypothetical protein